MSALQQVSSSSTLGSERKMAMSDERKRKRMISNRESARRSRMRRQKLVADLTNEARLLQDANKGVLGKIERATEMCVVCGAENNVLRAQAMELNERLRGLNEVIQCSGFDVDEDGDDPLLRPWQLPSSAQPVVASLGFQHQFGAKQPCLVNGLDVDVDSDIADPLLKPWHLPRSSQPIMASSGFLHEF